MSREIQFLDAVMICRDVMDEFIRKSEEHTIKTSDYEQYLKKKNDLYREIFDNLLEETCGWMMRCRDGFILQTDTNANTVVVSGEKENTVLHAAAMTRTLMHHAVAIALLSENRILDTDVCESMARQSVLKPFQAICKRLEPFADQVIQPGAELEEGSEDKEM